MTQDEIIEMAKESSFTKHSEFEKCLVCNPISLYHFAKRVAAKEREACAEMCKKHADVYGAFEPTPSFQAAWAACIDLRDQIRARGTEA